MKSTSKFLGAAAFGALLFLSPLSRAAPAPGAMSQAPAASAIKPGDPVVATVDGQDIKRSEVLSFIAALPDQVKQMPIEKLFPLAQEQVIDNKLVSKKAAAAKLDNDPEVVKLQAQAHDQIIRNVYLERQLAAQIDQKRLVKAYEDVLDKNTNVNEVHAKHILVDSEAKAKDIIKKLDAGAKFDDLAKANSTDPGTAKNGGDLGYFAKTEMVPEFADAAFALDPGKYTKNPVKTQFGWHVIEVVDKRKRPEPKFEDVKPQIEAMVRQQVLQQMVTDMQKDAKITKFDINGEPVKDAPAASAKK